MKYFTVFCRSATTFANRRTILLISTLAFPFGTVLAPSAFAQGCIGSKKVCPGGGTGTTGGGSSGNVPRVIVKPNPSTDAKKNEFDNFEAAMVAVARDGSGTIEVHETGSSGWTDQLEIEFPVTIEAASGQSVILAPGAWDHCIKYESNEANKTLKIKDIQIRPTGAINGACIDVSATTSQTIELINVGLEITAPGGPAVRVSGGTVAISASSKILGMGKGTGIEINGSNSSASIEYTTIEGFETGIVFNGNKADLKKGTAIVGNKVGIKVDALNRLQRPNLTLTEASISSSSAGIKVAATSNAKIEIFGANVSSATWDTTGIPASGSVGILQEGMSSELELSDTSLAPVPGQPAIKSKILGFQTGIAAAGSVSVRAGELTNAKNIELLNTFSGNVGVTGSKFHQTDKVKVSSDFHIAVDPKEKKLTCRLSGNEGTKTGNKKRDLKITFGPKITKRRTRNAIRKHCGL